MYGLTITFPFSLESRQIMSYSAVVSFHRKGFRFGLKMLPLGNKLLVAFPIIRTKVLYIYIFKFVPKSCSGLRRTVSADKRDEPFSKSINSNPYPRVVFLEPTYV